MSVRTLDGVSPRLSISSTSINCAGCGGSGPVVGGGTYPLSDTTGLLIVLCGGGGSADGVGSEYDGVTLVHWGTAAALMTPPFMLSGERVYAAL